MFQTSRYIKTYSYGFNREAVGHDLFEVVLLYQPEGDRVLNRLILNKFDIT